jgi:outer membrane receptor for ferrienterochelin and colicins
VIVESSASESETDLTEDILFEDIESVYSASKYDQKVTEAAARISIVTAEEIQRFSYRTLADVMNS